MHVEHTLVLRDTNPEKWREFCSDPDLTPMMVMQENMTFFHIRAGQVLAAIMLRPLGEDEDQTRLEALQDLAGVIKMREMAQQCARDLAPYVHAKKAPETRKEAQGAGKAAQQAIQHIPTPQSVTDAFQRVVDGLPPEPRKRL